MNRRQFLQFSLAVPAAAFAPSLLSSDAVDQSLRIHLFGADYTPLPHTTLADMLEMELPSRMYEPAEVEGSLPRGIKGIVVGYEVMATGTIFGAFASCGPDLVVAERWPMPRDVIPSDILDVVVRIT